MKGRALSPDLSRRATNEGCWRQAPVTVPRLLPVEGPPGEGWEGGGLCGLHSRWLAVLKASSDERGHGRSAAGHPHTLMSPLLHFLFPLCFSGQPVQSSTFVALGPRAGSVNTPAPSPSPPGAELVLLARLCSAVHLHGLMSLVDF